MTLDTFSLRPLSFVLFSALFFVSPTMTAQIRCGTVEAEKRRALIDPFHESTEHFEKWMKAKLIEAKSNGAISGRTESVSYTIPVVVHIIYNPSDVVVGTGTNLSVAQIQSQIAAVNRDYPRLNADSVNTPAEFEKVAGKINMKFVLAKQDPEGVPSNGITRTPSTQASYTMAEEANFKSLSYWPAEDYLNIWVINMVDPSGVIGFASLPISTTLPGLETAQTNRLLDGVTINYLEFGDVAGGNFTLDPHFNTGRTGTHEIGHIFGLRHVWGDVVDNTGGGDQLGTNCLGTDYCDDTPPQDSATFGCPKVNTMSCNPAHHKMFQNYMDYTDDDCYNLFTQDQIARMVVILGNSPRRASLLVSNGASDPTLFANDLGVRKIISPDITACFGIPIDPVLQIRNYGNNSITTAQIQFSVNGIVTETKDFTLSLNYLDTVNVSFSPITLSQATSYQLSYSVLSTNGTTDGNSANNLLTSTIKTPSPTTVPFVEPFNSLPSTWSVQNPDSAIGGKTWQNVTAPYTSTSNTAMYIDFYDYDDLGAQDRLISPVFDLSSATAAVLKFDYSYSVFSTANPDGLEVVISTTCDSRNTVVLFNKSGSALATAANSQTAFVPKSAGDWVTATIDISQFLGQSNVQITFIGINQNGNNLYLDNVSVTTSFYTDIALTKLKSPSPVTCLDNPIPVINVVNLGSLPITTFTVSTVINSSGIIENATFTNVDLATGQDADFTLPAWSLTAGTNTIKLTLSTPGTDIEPNNNILSLNEVSNASQAPIPFRQNFDGAYPEWSIVNPLQQANWISTATATTDRDISLEYKAFSNTVFGSQAWLVSPVLLLSPVSKASVFFDLSYELAAKGVDELQILGSRDCGVTFNTVLFDQSSDSLALYNGVTKKTSVTWSPQQDTDWKRQFVNLDKITGSDQARIAFVVTNGNGNNLFLDNVEFFVEDNNSPVSINSLYSVYNNFTPNVKITFNLPSPESVRMQVVTMVGQTVIDDTFTQVLNQTYTLDLNGKSAGVYIIHLQIGNVIGTAKVVLTF